MEAYFEKDAFLVRTSMRSTSYRQFIRKYLLAQLDMMIVFITWQIDFIFTTIAFVRDFISNSKKYETEHLASSGECGDPSVTFALSEKSNDSGNSTMYVLADCEEIQKSPDDKLYGNSPEYMSPAASFKAYGTSSDTVVRQLTKFREIMHRRRNEFRLLKSFSTPRQVNRTRFLEKSDIMMAPRLNRLVDVLNTDFIAKESEPCPTKSAQMITCEGSRTLDSLSNKETDVTTQMENKDLDTPAKKVSLATKRGSTSMKSSKTPANRNQGVKRKISELDNNLTPEDALTIIQTGNRCFSDPSKNLKDQSTSRRDVSGIQALKKYPKVPSSPRIRSEGKIPNLKCPLRKDNDADTAMIQEDTTDMELPMNSMILGDIADQETDINDQESNGKGEKIGKEVEASSRKEAASHVKKQVKVTDLVTDNYSSATSSARVSETCSKKMVREKIGKEVDDSPRYGEVASPVKKQVEVKNLETPQNSIDPSASISNSRVREMRSKKMIRETIGKSFETSPRKRVVASPKKKVDLETPQNSLNSTGPGSSGRVRETGTKTKKFRETPPLTMQLRSRAPKDNDQPSLPRDTESSSEIKSRPTENGRAKRPSTSCLTLPENYECGRKMAICAMKRK